MCEGRVCIKRWSSSVLPTHGIGEELSGLPSEACKVLKEEERNIQMKAKTGSLGDRDMFGLAKMPFGILEPSLKIRFHTKIQISGYF